MPYVDQAGHDFPDARSVHEASLAACPDPAAYAIPVEEIAGEVLVSAGGDDRVWPAQRFCEEIVARRRAAGRETTYVFHRDAGHRLVLPGEEPRRTGPGFPRGGTPEPTPSTAAPCSPRCVLALNSISSVDLAP